jgi:Trypsin-like peptidase domain
MISKDHFLTAGHCFDQHPNGWTVPRINGTNNPITSAEIATNMHVNFNFQVDPNGSLRTEQSFAIVELVEHRLGGIDYAIARIDGDPGLIFGFTQVSSQDPNIGDMICIIGHPEGLPKRIEAGPVTDFHDNLIGYNDIDTLPGNSGSGIISAEGLVVGVHTNGGCDDKMLGHNHGQRISSIRAISPYLQIPSFIADIDFNKWVAVFILLLGGVTKGGTGIGITPSGKPVPIDPGPLLHLPKNKQDILIGMAITELSSIINDVKVRLEIEKAGVNVMSKSIDRIRKSISGSK